MKREEQILFIIKIIQKQRSKKPNATEKELLKSMKVICAGLVESDDLDKDIVDKTLSLIFEKETNNSSISTKVSSTTIYDDDPCGSSFSRRSYGTRGGC